MMPDPPASEPIACVPVSPQVPPPSPHTGWGWAYDPKFSPLVTGLAAALLIACAGLISYVMWISHPLDRIADPERALGHMVGRSMDMQAAMAQAPAWERAFSDWTAGDSARERAEAIAWYRELAARSADSTAALPPAILLAETSPQSDGPPPMTFGRPDQADDTSRLYTRLMQVAYGQAPVTPGELLELQALAADALPSGWFYEHLARRLADRQGDPAQGAALAATGQARADRLLARSRVLTAVQVGMLVVGAVVLVRLATSAPAGWLQVSSARLPPPWPGRLGAQVFVRGGALGSVAMVLMMFYGASDDLLLRVVAVPLTYLPLVLLAQRHLLDPAGVGIRGGFGLRVMTGRGYALWAAVAAVVGAGLLGEWLLGRLAEWGDLPTHWAEWFDVDLVWASGPTLAISLMEYVVFAPLFEEMTFRGLLFGLLRRRLAFGPAALISALLFAAAHGYGIVGFLGVCWSGVLWAWSYEKTGSLLPGMLAHAFNNLLVCLSVMALLR